MSYEVKDHKLYCNGQPVKQMPSPNRGGVMTPEVIVVHFTGDNGTGGLEWLRSRQSKVSAHLWISKKGEVIQLLPFNVIGWHAGVSEYEGIQGVNAFSIGIENQEDRGDDWPEAQMEANRQVIRALYAAYPTIGDIVGHDEIAPGRKVDPGALFWERLYAEK